jgi:hypothetical protein
MTDADAALAKMTDADAALVSGVDAREQSQQQLLPEFEKQSNLYGNQL